MALDSFLAGVLHGKEEEWPLSLLSSPETAQVRELAEYLHKLDRLTQLSPYSEEIRQGQEKLRAQAFHWQQVVLDRGKEAAPLLHRIGEIMDSLKQRHRDLSQREANLADVRAGLATLGEEMKASYQELVRRQSDLDAQEARLCHKERQLAAREEKLQGLASAKREAQAWWESLKGRIGSAFACLPEAPLPMGEEYVPSPEEMALLKARATANLRQRTGLPESIGAVALHGRFSLGLRAVSFKTWPVPHIVLAQRLTFSGKAELAAVAEVEGYFGGWRFAWPQGTPVLSAPATVTTNNGQYPVPLCLLRALATPALSLPGVAPRQATESSIAFAVKGWRRTLTLPRSVAEKLGSLLRGGADPIETLTRAGILGDSLLAGLMTDSLRGGDAQIAPPPDGVGDRTPLERCLLSLIEAEEYQWSGTPSALLDALLQQAKMTGIPASELPTTPSSLSRYLGDALCHLDVSLERQRTGRARWLRLRRMGAGNAY